MHKDEPIWFEERTVLAIHEMQLAEHGGASGIRDHGLLISGLDRAKNAFHYQGADIPALAAIYALGIINNHPFIDGNKRTGSVLLQVYLELHGYRFIPTDAEFYDMIVSLSSSEMSDEAFTDWVRSNSRHNV